MTAGAARLVILAATFFGGLLAGASVDRYLVQVPAWRRMDVLIWAEHSRRADLGNGRFWYPVLAFVSTGLAMAATYAVRARDLAVPGLAAPLYLAAMCELLGLSLTIFAAPNLIRLRQPQDRVVTENSFRRFHAWGLPRAALQTAAFPLLLWAVWVLLDGRR